MERKRTLLSFFLSFSSLVLWRVAFVVFAKINALTVHGCEELAPRRSVHGDELLISLVPGVQLIIVAFYYLLLRILFMYSWMGCEEDGILFESRQWTKFIFVILFFKYSG